MNIYKGFPVMAMVIGASADRTDKILCAAVGAATAIGTAAIGTAAIGTAAVDATVDAAVVAAIVAAVVTAVTVGAAVAVGATVGAATVIGIYKRVSILTTHN